MQNVQLVFRSYADSTVTRISADDANLLLTHVLTSEAVFQLVFDNWDVLEPCIRGTAARSAFWLFEACIAAQDGWQMSPIKPEFRDFLTTYLVTRTVYGDDPAEFLELPLSRCYKSPLESSEADGVQLALRCIDSATFAESCLPLIVDSSHEPISCSESNNEPTNCTHSEQAEPSFSSRITSPDWLSVSRQVQRHSVQPITALRKDSGQLDVLVTELRQLNIIEVEINEAKKIEAEINGQNDPIIAALSVQILADPRLEDVSILIVTDRPRHDTYCTLLANLSGLDLWGVEVRLSVDHQGCNGVLRDTYSSVKRWCDSSRLRILCENRLTPEAATTKILPHILELQKTQYCAHVVVFIDIPPLSGSPDCGGIEGYADAINGVLRLADLNDGCSIVAFTGQKLAKWKIAEGRSVAISEQGVSIEINEWDRVLSLDSMTLAELKRHHARRDSKGRERGHNVPGDSYGQFMTLREQTAFPTRKGWKLFLELDHDRMQVQVESPSRVTV